MLQHYLFWLNINLSIHVFWRACLTWCIKPRSQRRMSINLWHAAVWSQTKLWPIYLMSSLAVSAAVPLISVSCFIWRCWHSTHPNGWSHTVCSQSLRANCTFRSGPSPGMGLWKFTSSLAVTPLLVLHRQLMNAGSIVSQILMRWHVINCEMCRMQLRDFLMSESADVLALYNFPFLGEHLIKTHTQGYFRMADLKI